ncbi:DgyrCDS4632 [Dimorphilus gyrociliatus]|uniref:DgyrCDS4632 n=1 Tax=Dimorphilus gyrociliatus TaxID=2664684 RepID=A0A7I8VH60_9ANNE|nr:DgyrCDS4632 [Dimorphilus gyrociliatus]
MGKPNFNGKWSMYKSEKFEDYLRANGADDAVIRMATSVQQDVEIHQNEDKFLIKILNVMCTRNTEFTVGEEFDYEAHGGIRTKGQPFWDGDKLVITFTPVNPDEAKIHIIKRQLVGEEMLQTMQVDDIICKRFFRRA